MADKAVFMAVCLF